MKSGLVLLVLIVACVSFVSCGVTLNGVQCGSKTCKRDEYCSPLQKSCEKCDAICDDSTHNYDLSLCMEKCQDYLHDLRYGNSNLRETVQRLSNMVTVTFVMVCLLFIGIALVIGIHFYRWKKKKNITLSSIKNNFFAKKSKGASDNHNEKQPDLRIEIPLPQPQTAQSDSPITVTTSISRRPAEDSTLDYAYDNPAMATTPNSQKANEGRL